MTQVLIDSISANSNEHRGGGRIICQGSEIKTIAAIAAIERQWSVIQANKYERFEFDFGAWRKPNAEPVNREVVLQACLCPF